MAGNAKILEKAPRSFGRQGIALTLALALLGSQHALADDAPVTAGPDQMAFSIDNMDKTVSENLNMSKPILSRFDLVFILRDRADKDLDRMVSSNIMKLYRSHTSATNNASNLQPPLADVLAPGESLVGERMPLSERLAWVTDFQKQPLPANLVRDYIAYAREYCKPRLTQEAAAVLKDYFMELR